MDYQKEGVTHILVSDRSTTELGQRLSIGAKRCFTVPDKGEFKSILGYYLWLTSGYETYREFYGRLSIKDAAMAKYNAQKTGDNSLYPIISKLIDDDKELLVMLKQNQLPLEYYEVVNDIAVSTPSFDWYIRLLQKKSAELNNAK